MTNCLASITHWLIVLSKFRSCYKAPGRFCIDPILGELSWHFSRPRRIRIQFTKFLVDFRKPVCFFAILPTVTCFHVSLIDIMGVTLRLDLVYEYLWSENLLPSFALINSLSVSFANFLSFTFYCLAIDQPGDNDLEASSGWPVYTSRMSVTMHRAFLLYSTIYSSEKNLMAEDIPQCIWQARYLNWWRVRWGFGWYHHWMLDKRPYTLR